MILQLTLLLSASASLAGPPPGQGETVHDTLPCGVELFLFDDPDATTVRGSILIDAGSEAERADRVGLVRVLSDALGRGGAADRSPAEIEAWFDAHGGDVNVSRDRRAIAFDFFCAPEALLECLELQRDWLAQPAYPEEQIADARRRLLAVMSSWEQNPQFVANRGIYEVAYGESVPGRRVLHVEDSEHISRDEILAFHAAHVGSNRLRIALSGPLPEGLPEAVEQLFDELGRTAPAPANEWPAFRTGGELKLVLFDVPAAEHTEIRVGFASVPLGHPDAPALHLWSAYHEQGRTRTRERPRSGDEAAASARVQFSFDRMVTAGVDVESAAAAEALAELIERCSPDADEPLDAERLERARAALLRLFAPDDNYARVRNTMLRHLSGRTDAQAAAHAARLESLTAEELLEAVRRHAPGAGLVAVVAGPAEALAPLLAPFASPGETLDVRSGLRQPRGTAAGLELRERLLAAAGGSERWATLDTLIYAGETIARGLDEPLAVRVEHDLARGASRVEHTLPGGPPIFNVSTPEASWTIVGENHVPLDAASHATLRIQEKRRVIQLLRSLALGRGVRVEAEGQRLVIHSGGEVLAWLELGADGLPALRGYEGPDGALHQSEIPEWSLVDGLAFPRRVRAPGVENSWLSFSPNAPLEPGLFVRPVR